MEKYIMLMNILDYARPFIGVIFLFWILYGIYILVSGRLYFPKPVLKGKYARLASLFIIIPYCLTLIAIYYIDDYYDLKPSSPIGNYIKDDLFAILVASVFLGISIFSFKAFSKSTSRKMLETDN